MNTMTNERLRSKLTVIDPEETVLIDVRGGTGDRKYRGRVTRLMFEMAPAR